MDLNAEAAVLSSMLNNNNVIDHVEESIIVSDFSTAFHRYYFSAIMVLHKTEIPITTDTIRTVFMMECNKGTVKYTESMVEDMFDVVLSGDSVDFYMEAMKK